VQLDPLEEELDLPPVTIELCNGGRRDGEVVGQEIERLVRACIVVPDTPERLRIVLATLRVGQRHRLVATHPARLSVDRSSGARSACWTWRGMMNPIVA